MRILRGNNLNVDFKSQIEMGAEKREKFIDFLKTLFYTVSQEEVKEFRSDRIGDKLFMKEWTVEELALIFKIDEVNEELVKKLGRTWMSVDMKRGMLIPQILEEAKNKKVDILKIDLKKFIQDFLDAHKEELLKHRIEKSEEKRKLKEEAEELEKLPEEISKEEKLIGITGMGITKESVEAKKKRLGELKKKVGGKGLKRKEVYYSI